jgi:hypothetical protein
MLKNSRAPCQRKYRYNDDVCIAIDIPKMTGFEIKFVFDGKLVREETTKKQIVHHGKKARGVDHQSFVVGEKKTAGEGFKTISRLDHRAGAKSLNVIAV